MEKCALICGRQFKNAQALGAHRRLAHKWHGAAQTRKVRAKALPVAQHRAMVAQSVLARPNVSIHVATAI